MKDRKLDPITHDYIPDGAGGFETTETIETEMQHQILDRFAMWWGDPSAGSMLYMLAQANLGERDRLLAKRYSEVALQSIVDGGRATNLRVTSRIDKTYQRIVVENTLSDVHSAGADVSVLTPLSRPEP